MHTATVLLAMFIAADKPEEKTPQVDLVACLERPMPPHTAKLPKDFQSGLTTPADGKIGVSYDGLDVILYDVETKKPVGEKLQFPNIKNPSPALKFQLSLHAFSKDGKFLIVAANAGNAREGEGSVALFDVKSGKVLKWISGLGTVKGVGFVGSTGYADCNNLSGR